MKVIVDKSSLSTATARSQGAVSEKNLAHIGLRAYDGKLQLTAADRILVIYIATSKFENKNSWSCGFDFFIHSFNIIFSSGQDSEPDSVAAL